MGGGEFTFDPSDNRLKFKERSFTTLTSEQFCKKYTILESINQRQKGGTDCNSNYHRVRYELQLSDLLAQALSKAETQIPLFGSCDKILLISMHSVENLFFFTVHKYRKK